MHHSKFIRQLEKDRPLLTPQQRQEEWEAALAKQQGTDLRDEGGPPEEPTRCSYHKEDYSVGCFGTEHSKDLELSSKGATIKDENQIEGSRQGLSEGHVGMDNCMFASSGGGSTAIEKFGKSLSMGHNLQQRTEVAVRIGSDAAFKEPALKKARHFQVDRERVKLSEVMSNKLKALVDSATKASQKAQTSMQMAQVVSAADIPGLEEYRSNLERRNKFMKCCQMSIKKDRGGVTEHGLQEPAIYDKGTVACEKCCEHAQEFKAGVEALHSVAGGEKTKFQELVAAVGGKIMAVDEKPHRVSIMLRQFVWDPAKGVFIALQQDQSADALLKVTSAVHIACSSECIFVSMAECCVKNRQPLPMQNFSYESIATVATLELDVQMCLHLESESEVNHYKKSFDAYSKSINDIISQVGVAARDNEALIERHTVKAVERQEKQKQREAEKQQQQSAKEVQKRLKAAGAEAKKAAKASGKAVVAAVPQAMKMPEKPPIVQAVEKLQSVETFDAEDAFHTGKADFFKDGKSVPYVIKAVETIERLMKETGVKQSADIYRLQFPNQELVQRLQRGFLPFANERKDKLSEALKSCSNDCTAKSTGFSNTFLTQQNALHICCAGFTMVHVGVERNFIGNLRYSESGRRQCILINFTGIEAIGTKHDVKIGAQEDVASWVQRALGCFEPADVDEKAVKDNSFYHECKEGELLGIPMGHATIEVALPKTVKAAGDYTAKEKTESFGLNLRIHYLEPPDSNGYKFLQAACDMQANQNIKGDTTLAYWKHLLTHTKKD